MEVCGQGPALPVIWQKTMEGFESFHCKINGRALVAALKHSLGGVESVDGQAQKQGVSKLAAVAAGLDRPGLRNSMQIGVAVSVQVRHLSHSHSYRSSPLTQIIDHFDYMRPKFAAKLDRDASCGCGKRGRRRTV